MRQTTATTTVLSLALGMTACASSVGTSPVSTGPSTAATRSTTSPATASRRHFAGMPHEDTAGYVVIAQGTGATASGGALTTGAAWSTIKVPLAVAALTHGGDVADVADAIEASKNPPADELWAALGTPDQAGPLVEAELAAGGDATTIVETDQTYPPYSAYGQTVWSLADQATYAMSLPCREAANLVYADMARIAPQDRIGFGATAMADLAHYKIGWGPGRAPDTNYYARELAVITLADGRTYGIALIAQDTSLGAAQQDLTEMASWLGPHLAELPARGC